MVLELVLVQEVAMLVVKRVMVAAVLVAVMELRQVDFVVVGVGLLGLRLVQP